MSPNLYGQSVVESFTTTSWASVASITWTVYDFVLTLEDEVQYVWRIPWCWGTWLFFLVRYGGFVITFIRLAWEIPAFIGTYALARHGHVELLPGMINWVLLSQFILFYSVEIALQMRIYAIYRRSRLLLSFNATLFAAEMAGMIFLWWHSGCRTMTKTRPWDGTNSVVTSACTQENGFPWYWISGFAFESWLATLAFYKVLQRAPREKLRKDILSTLVTDSGIYFGLITIVMGVHLGSASHSFDRRDPRSFKDHRLVVCRAPLLPARIANFDGVLHCWRDAPDAPPPTHLLQTETPSLSKRERDWIRPSRRFTVLLGR